MALYILPSITGLARTADYISTEVLSSVDGSMNATNTARSELNIFKMDISSLQQYLSGATVMPVHRASMIPLNALIATMMETILLFSDFVHSIKPPITLGSVNPTTNLVFTPLPKYTSVLAEEDIHPFVSRLRRHRGSFSSILRALQCDSDQLARIYGKKCQMALTRTLERDEDMATRLQRLEDKYWSDQAPPRVEANTNNTKDEDCQSAQPDTVEVVNAAEVNTVEAVEDSDETWTLVNPIDSNQGELENISATPHELPFRFALENEPVASSVDKPPHEQEAVTTDIEETKPRWRVSTLTLADTFAFSAIALPVNSSDIHNSSHYMFETPSSSDVSKTEGQIQRLATQFATRIVSPPGESDRALKNQNLYFVEFPSGRLNWSSSRRLKTELSAVATDVDPEVFVASISDDLAEWEGKLSGPDDSPYRGGVFHLSIRFPEAYPFKPPHITFKTRIYHPNIDIHGNISINILQGGWCPALSTRKVLLSIQSILHTPLMDYPLVPDVARKYNTDRPAYEAKAREWTKIYAMGTEDGETNTPQ